MKKTVFIGMLTPTLLLVQTVNAESTLVAPADGIQSLAQLNSPDQPRIALTQPDSTCGWLVTDQLLQEHGFDLEILKTSDSMPPFVLVANAQTLSSTELQKVTQALLNDQPALHHSLSNKP